MNEFIHWAEYINQEEGTSWSTCGKLIANNKILQSGTCEAEEITCKRCIAGLRRQDERETRKW